MKGNKGNSGDGTEKWTCSDQVPADLREVVHAWAKLGDALKADVAGIETINVIKNIVSNIKFKNKEITIENLQAQVLETPVTAQGTLKQNMLNGT